MKIELEEAARIVFAPDARVIIVVMGVAASGKTHVGRALAARLGWPFHDADDFHPPDNIATMASGVPLTDAHREGWLLDLRALLLSVGARRGNAVLACSALRARFRDRLREGVSDLRYVYLKAERELIARRLRERTGHFMPAELLDSQFATLEEPVDALIVDASEPADALIAQIRESLRL